MRNNLVIIEDTKFIFDTNFSGDPRRDRFGSTQRKGSIVIPDIEQARRLIDEGYTVKLTRPKEGEEEGFVPKYFVQIKINYDSQWPPRVYLITDSGETLLNADTIGNVDDIWVDKVNVVLNKYESVNGKSLWIKSMEVFQKVDEDPISMRHSKINVPEYKDDNAIQFN